MQSEQIFTHTLHRAYAVPAQSLRTENFPAAARFVLTLLHKLSVGSLTVTFPDGQCARFGSAHGTSDSSADDVHAEIVLNNWKVCVAALNKGDIGFGETYIDGDWSTPNLSALMHVMIANRNAIEAVIYGQSWARLIYRVKHLLRRNSRSGSRKNIHAHYDIGNAFYQLWLDPTMTYSSALFAPQSANAGAGEDTDAANLAAAQCAKYQRILDELALPAGKRVLEIGCGWGGFAEQAASAGLAVTGLTISTEQLAYAQTRLQNASVDALADLRLQDYRDQAHSEAPGGYDGIASIEMFEAVGEQYWPDYFRSIKHNLAPAGRAAIQTIVIDDAYYDHYRRGSDFIQQYIFPGGMMASPSVFAEKAKNAGLKVVNAYRFGQDYARTLKVWLSNFEAHETEVRAGGFDTRFIRTWAFYLAYCEAAFRNANIDVIQYTLAHA